MIEMIRGLQGWIRGQIDGLNAFGLALGALFFAASLTPSLLPRPVAIQGLLSGVALAAGYGLGVTCVRLWTYLQLPVAPDRLRRIFIRIALAIGAVCIVASLWRAAQWQNSIRELMGMEELTTAQPYHLGGIALLVFSILIVVARILSKLIELVSQRLQRFLRPRAAKLLGVLASLWLVWAITNGILIRFAMRAIDRSFQQLDAMIDDQLPMPENDLQTGSQASLVDWKDLGNQGRQFVAGGPTAEDLKSFFGQPCPAPIRVYVGLNSADSAELRAKLALEELIRVGGFERSTLLLVTPTGTGWVDPASQDSVEYLHRGDLATVAVQYSYLNSPLTLLTDAEYGMQMAQALFETIYGHWRSLPKDSRPRLFLHGLSLGSLNSDLSFQMFDIIDDPFDGALWSGPPFLHKTWRQATRQRTDGSPAWLPEVQGGNVIRFMNQHGNYHQGQSPWGAFRIGFLQHPSDPIVFFEPESAWRKPAWMNAPRGPDVSSQLQWFPIVTMLQLATDMIVGTAPMGFGHTYSHRDYIAAWLGLTEPPSWDEAELARLVKHFEETDRSPSVGAQ
jgi:uncharacterized membrane protein